MFPALQVDKIVQNPKFSTIFPEEGEIVVKLALYIIFCSFSWTEIFVQFSWSELNDGEELFSLRFPWVKLMYREIFYAVSLSDLRMRERGFSLKFNQQKCTVENISDRVDNHGMLCQDLPGEQRLQRPGQHLSSLWIDFGWLWHLTYVKNWHICSPPFNQFFPRQHSEMGEG